MQLIKRMYYAQVKNSFSRGHAPPNYSKEELIEWVRSQPNFNHLYLAYAKSGFQTKLIPSCDRLDNNKPYTLDNIRLITFHENQKANGQHCIKAVIRIDWNNKETLYESGAIAEQATGIHKSNIFKVCKGLRKTAGNARWKYAKG